MCSTVTSRGTRSRDTRSVDCHTRVEIRCATLQHIHSAAKMIHTQSQPFTMNLANGKPGWKWCAVCEDVP
jgi:hypothetical protein